MSLAAEQLDMTAELSTSLETTDEERRLVSIPVGLHENVPESVYHAPVLGMASKSALDELRKSPAHYRAWLDGLRIRDTKALHLGKATHCAVHEPDRFARDYVIAPDFGDCRKKENKAERDRWLKEHASAIVLKNDDGLATMGMIRALSQHRVVRSLFDGGTDEVTLRWSDPATKVACKARVDRYRPDLRAAMDLKTIDDASGHSVRRAIANYGYHRQDAFYRFGFAELGVPVDFFVFVFVEKSPPHAITICSIDAEDIGRGHQENCSLLERMATCLERDEWPAYPDTIQTVRLPAWATEERQSW